MGNKELLRKGKRNGGIDIDVVKETPFRPNRGFEVKSYLVGKTVSETREGGHVLHLVKKKVSTVEYDGTAGGAKSDSEAFFNKWTLLKKFGVPTIPSVRISDDNHVMMTDLTRDGSDLYGKYKYNHYKMADRPDKNELVNQFLALDFDQVKRRAEEIEMILFTNGLVAPVDDPWELWLHPDGTWEVIILDVGGLQYRKQEDIHDDDISYLMDCLTHIRKILRKK